MSAVTRAIELKLLCKSTLQQSEINDNRKPQKHASKSLFVFFDDTIPYVVGIETVYRYFDTLTHHYSIVRFRRPAFQFPHPVDDQFASAQAQRETGN